MERWKSTASRILGVASCCTALLWSGAANGQKPSAGEVVYGAKQAIRERSFDPDAVKFKDVFTHKATGKNIAACGQFNAKNRYGGYAGFKHFISDGSQQNTLAEDEVNGFRKVWNVLCAGK